MPWQNSRLVQAKCILEIGAARKQCRSALDKLPHDLTGILHELGQVNRIVQLGPVDAHAVEEEGPGPREAGAWGRREDDEQDEAGDAEQGGQVDRGRDPLAA